MIKAKTTFMIEATSYCYKVMPFGLKNVGATYQKLMDKILLPMFGRNVQGYVDDIEVISVKADDHIADLEELFATIVGHNLKLNPEKCTSRVRAGQFLGFMLTKKGIEANPEKCSSIMERRSPTNEKGSTKINQEHGRSLSLSLGQQ